VSIDALSIRDVSFSCKVIANTTGVIAQMPIAAAVGAAERNAIGEELPARSPAERVPTRKHLGVALEASMTLVAHPSAMRPSTSARHARRGDGARLTRPATTRILAPRPLAAGRVGAGARPAIDRYQDQVDALASAAISRRIT
jgi:hypothetical protein